MSSQKLGNDMVSEIIDRKERNKERKEGRRKEKKRQKSKNWRGGKFMRDMVEGEGDQAARLLKKFKTIFKSFSCDHICKLAFATTID